MGLRTMTRGGSQAAAAAAPWAPDEAAAFFHAFHQHGQDFERVAAAVGGARSAVDCEALHRRQQAYLSIPSALQSAQAFSALVENAQQQREAAAGDEGDGGGEDEYSDDEAGEEAAEGGEPEGDGEEEGGDGRRAAAPSGRSRRTPKRSGGLTSPGGGTRVSG